MTTDRPIAGLWRRFGAFGFDYLWIAAWLLAVVAIGANFVSAMVDSRRRSLYDRAAGTRVVMA